MGVIIQFPNRKPPTKAKAKIESGDRVFHPGKYGYGTVVAVDGRKVIIDFDLVGRKLVWENFIQTCDDGDAA